MCLLILALVIALVGVLFITGCSHRRCGHHGKSAEKIVKRLSSYLDLNETQSQKLSEIKDEVITKFEGFKGSKTAVKEAIIEQTRGDQIDEAALNSLFETKESQWKETRAFLISKYAEFHAVLTPDQRTKLADKAGKMHKRWGKSCRHHG